MRRQCQEILPGVLLGPLQASKSLETLKSLGVTHMCVVHGNIVLDIIRTHSVCSECVYATRRRHSLFVQDILNTLCTSFSMWRTMRNKISSGSFLGTSRVRSTAVAIRIDSSHRANEFLDSALSRGGRVLVHCNGEAICSSCQMPWSLIFSDRWYQSISCIRCHVCYATSSDKLGGRAAHGAESTVLHFSQRWLLDPNQGRWDSPLFHCKVKR